MSSIQKLKCLRLKCGNEWFPRSEQKPKVCPMCKSYKWDVSPREVENEIKDGQATVEK